MAKYKVLSTKKLEPAQHELAAKKSIEIIEKEFISIQHNINEEARQKILQLATMPVYVVLTSANAVQAIDAYLLAAEVTPATWKVFCISGRTKTAVEQSVLQHAEIMAVADDAASLAEEIKKTEIKEVHFLCGNRRRFELPEALTASGIAVHELVVYETTGTPETINTEFDCILFFSPSGVESFFNANQLKEDTVCFAIGPTTADSIKSFTGNQVITSKSPTPSSIFSALLFYFQTRPSETEEHEEGPGTAKEENNNINK